MVPLFHKFSCYSLHFRVQYLMLEVSSHQLLVLIVPPPHSQNQKSSTPIAHINSLGSTSLPWANQPTSASVCVSRAELFSILDTYVQKSEFQRLQGRYEKRKRKLHKIALLLKMMNIISQLSHLEMIRCTRSHYTSWKKPSLMKK